MTLTRLNEIFGRIKDLPIGVIGDACLDIYWHADMTQSTLSRETPMFPLPVYKEEFSLGAAGNAAVNAGTLGAKVSLLALIGQDWRSSLFLDAMKTHHIGTDYLITSPDLTTPAYCKPIRHGISSVVYEDSRLDFANRSPYGLDIQERVLECIGHMAENCSALIVVDQLAFLVNDAIRAYINKLAQKHLILVDSRRHIASFTNCIIKPNEAEAFKALYPEKPEPASYSSSDIKTLGSSLARSCSKGLLITAGEKGTYWFKGMEHLYAPTRPAEPPIDVVGCGDNFMACFAASYAAGASLDEAMAIGNLGAGVTVKKIGTTGASTPEEIQNKYKEFYS